MRYNNFISDPSLLSFINYASMGTDEVVVGAVNPDDPFSADHWLSSIGLAGFFAGGAGVATRGAVNSLKPGPRSSGAVSDVKPGSKSSGPVNDVKSGSRSSGSVSDVKSGSKSSGSVSDVKSGSRSSGSVNDVKSDSRSSGSSDVKETGKSTDNVVKEISAADRAKLDGWTYRPSDEMYLKYKKTFDNPKYYDQKTGDIQWPPNDGFKGKRVTTTIEPGAVLDRYGDPGGKYLSPAGTPYEQRALALHSDNAPYHQYRVKEAFTVEGGEIAPWFDRPGGGTQYFTGELKIQDLLDADIIEKIN